jgi:hypothetical protein
MHYLILGSTFIFACFSILNLHSRSMIYQAVPVNKRRRY